MSIFHKSTSLYANTALANFINILKQFLISSKEGQFKRSIEGLLQDT
jgi:hypothetical protein